MSRTVPRLEFWYEFASTYSYLSAMRIEPLASAAGVAVEWKPFLLGPIFQAQGWHTSPFTLYPAKGRHMVRDIERIAAERGLRFALPGTFPQNSLQASRVALLGGDEGWVAPFTRAVYLAEFADGADIADRAVLAAILRGLGLDPERIIARIDQPDLKQRLKQQTIHAQERGLFGALSFVVGNELFWGDDRLEQALAWAKRE
ncbi:MAG: 2-hydroxychromene-2-carboxylate isomerase [Hyphomicrobiaceae bacterium]